MRWYLAGVASCFALLGLLSCTTLIPVSGPTAVWDISASGVDFRGSQPTGVILLTTASTRNNEICQAFTGPGGLPSREAVATINVRVTYWLWKGNYQGVDKTCANLVANYDFDRAQSILAQASGILHLPLTNSIGPVFVGFAGGDNTTAFVLDGSNVPTSGLPDFINKWKGEIIQDQAVLAKAQQATTSGAATATGNNVTPKAGNESGGFWSSLWDTIKPALSAFAAALVPIGIAVIKGLLHVA